MIFDNIPDKSAKLTKIYSKLTKFIYFFDFGYFMILSSEEQIYVFMFTFVTDDSCFASVTLLSTNIATYKLTSHSILHYLWAVDLSRNSSQLIVSILSFELLIVFSQYYFNRF